MITVACKKWGCFVLFAALFPCRAALAGGETLDPDKKFVTNRQFSLQFSIGGAHRERGWGDWGVGVGVTPFRTGSWRWLTPGVMAMFSETETSGLLTFAPTMKRIGEWGDIGGEEEVNFFPFYARDFTNGDNIWGTAFSLGFKFPWTKH